MDKYYWYGICEIIFIVEALIFATAGHPFSSVLMGMAGWMSYRAIKEAYREIKRERGSLMVKQECEHQDPFVSRLACMRLGIQKHPYGVPDKKAGCPCKRNLIIQKATCGFIAFRDCLTQGGSPMKHRELRLTLNLGEFRGIYSPLVLKLCPFLLRIHLIIPHVIRINIGKLCRFAKFKFEVKNWTVIFRNMRRRQQK